MYIGGKYHGKNFWTNMDFQYRRAEKLENSSYLEELTGLLAKVASSIDDETKYFFGDKYYLKSHTGEPNSSFKYFIEDLKNSFYYSTGSKINIIRGRAGIGNKKIHVNAIDAIRTLGTMFLNALNKRTSDLALHFKHLTQFFFR